MSDENSGGRTEACGRCSMSTVVDAVNGDRDSDERAEHDPFGEARIEVDEDEVRRISPAGWLADRKAELDALARRLAYGR